MNFFYLAVDSSRNVSPEDLARLQHQAEKKKSDLKPDDLKNYIESHADILHRVLFIYAKLNPGIKYVQGMNELLAVLYFCFWLTGDKSSWLIIHVKLVIGGSSYSDVVFCSFHR